jgi:hypothetical protein
MLLWLQPKHTLTVHSMQSRGSTRIASQQHKACTDMHLSSVPKTFTSTPDHVCASYEPTTTAAPAVQATQHQHQPHNNASDHPRASLWPKRCAPCERSDWEKLKSCDSSMLSPSSTPSAAAGRLVGWLCRVKPLTHTPSMPSTRPLTPSCHPLPHHLSCCCWCWLVGVKQVVAQHVFHHLQLLLLLLPGWVGWLAGRVESLKQHYAAAAGWLGWKPSLHHAISCLATLCCWCWLVGVKQVMAPLAPSRGWAPSGALAHTTRNTVGCKPAEDAHKHTYTVSSAFSVKLPVDIMLATHL